MMNSFKKSYYHHICQDEEVIPGRAILYATRTGAAVEMSNEQLHFYQEENWGDLPPKLLTKLVKVEAIVPTEEDELSYVLQMNEVSIQDQDLKSLSYIIQPTANCQLGCHYCGQQHAKKNMTLEMAELVYDRIKTQVEALPSLTNMNITWYGGEPLAGLSTLVYLSDKLQELARNHKINYDAHIVTNGLNLKPSLFEKLVLDHKITTYQITVDGTQEFHDQRRMLKNDNPSFALIFNNIKQIVELDIYKQKRALINLRSNVDAENRDNIFTLLEMLHKEDILSKITYYVSPIHDWGDNEASKINGISKEDFAQFEIDIYLKLLEYGLLGNKHIVPTRTTKPCMVVSRTSEVMDTYGNVSTCWEVPYTPFYENTDFITGNLNKTTDIDTTNASMRNWNKEIPTNDSWCKSCKFLPLCGGACPKNWYLGTPACPSFKFNIDDRLLMKRMLATS